MVHRLAILGHPLGHSLSPIVHTTALAACGLEGTYETCDVRPDDLTRIWKEQIRNTYTGCNVTIPHKVAMSALCDALSDTARATGAVNTLVRRGDLWEGHNTDVVGLRDVLEPFADRIAGKEATVIGAGGAARAAIMVLAGLGIARLHIVNRDPERARQLAGEWERHTGTIEVHSMAEPAAAQCIKQSSLVMQMTSVGMHPRPDERVLPGAALFRKDQIAFDAVYRPRQTRFLADATAAGAITIDGLGMFLHQAAASFELWTGQRPPLESLRKTIEHKMAEI